jgi:hypothetical protein
MTNSLLFLQGIKWVETMVTLFEQVKVNQGAKEIHFLAIPPGLL